VFGVPFVQDLRFHFQLGPKSVEVCADCDGMNSANSRDWNSVRAVNLPGKAWPTSPLAGVMLRSVCAAVYGASKGADFLRDVASEVGVSSSGRSGTREMLTNGLASVWPVMPLQIGVVDAGEWAAQLVASHGVMGVQWTEIEESAFHDGRLLTKDGGTLDGVVRKTSTGVELLTLLRPGHDAGVQDWAKLASSTTGGGFAQLFPLRQDCLQLTMHANDSEIDTQDTRCARLLIEAACLLSRHPARTELGDRLSGRAADWSNTSAGQASLNAIFTALQAELEETDDLRALSDVRQMAAHLLSQWAATSPTITQAQRNEVATLCADLLPGDAFATLRLAAVKLGELDDAAGMDALADAAHALKQQNNKPIAEQTPFLLAELESGMGHPLSLGRVAAGITLAAATFSASELKQYRDDLRDELRFSSALLGKDQDRFVIEQVFGMLAEQAEGFVSQIASEDDEYVPVLAFDAARVADEGSALAGDEVQDDSSSHGFLQLAADAPLNPWQAMISQPAKRAATSKRLRLTSAKAKSRKPAKSKSKTTAKTAVKQIAKSKSLTTRAMKSKKKAA
jgi:hypothetical protein